MTDFLDTAKSYFDHCQKHRRHLHQHPELSLKEHDTSEYCKNVMQRLGYQVTPCWRYGFVADLVIDEGKPFKAWRADMDALPILEKNTHDFVSQNNGVAHMCGHDSHMAIALTAAEILIKQREQLQHNIRFVFQPSEETPPGGAPGMIEQGCLENVDSIFGLHNNPELPSGSVHTCAGGFLAGADIFKLTITGRGGHAARPHQCLDPVYTSAQLISNWQSIVSRKIAPTHTAILSITQCVSGNTYNVIPNTAELAGTIRHYNTADRDAIVAAMKAYCEPYIQQGFEFEWQYVYGYDPVINHTSAVELIDQCARQIMDADMIDTDCDPEGFGEDFCYYLQHVPGAYFMLGSGNEQKCKPLHSAEFDIDEPCMNVGVALACDLLTSPILLSKK